MFNGLKKTINVLNFMLELSKTIKIFGAYFSSSSFIFYSTCWKNNGKLKSNGWDFPNE